MLTKTAKKLPLSGLEKTAVLLNILGKDHSLKFMKEMNDGDIRRLLNVMGQMKRAPIQLINAVMKEYILKLSENDEIIFEEDLSDAKLITEGLGEERARKIFGTLKEVNLVNRKNLTAIENVDGKTLSEFLISEHPQTIAIVVAHLDVAKQLEVIRNFPEGIRPEVIMRMAALEYVSPEKVEELDTILKKELAGRTGKEKKQFGGVSAVAELINSLDKKTMNSLMTRLEDKDPLLSEEIKASMFSFADIAKIDDRGIQLILREVPQDKLLLALKSATDELREKVFGAMSERAAQMMRDDLSALGPQKVSDVEKAQREIIKVVKRLEEEGKIIVGMGEGGDVVN